MGTPALPGSKVKETVTAPRPHHGTPVLRLVSGTRYPSWAACPVVSVNQDEKLNKEWSFIQGSEVGSILAHFRVF